MTRLNFTLGLLAAAFCCSALAAGPTAVYGSFEYYKSVDQTTKSDSSFVATGPDDYYLAWQCSKGSLRIFVHADHFLNSEDGIPVAYHFDSLPAVGPTGWNSSEKGTGAFAPHDAIARFTQKALASRKISMTVTDRKKAVSSYSFELNGLKQALAQLPCARGAY